MATNLEESKKMSVATALANMKLIQSKIIDVEQKLLSAVSGDQNIVDRFQSMIEDDRQSLSKIDQAIASMAMNSQPDSRIQEFVSGLDSMMSGDKLTTFEKVMEFEALKHKMVMMGLVIHKAAQVVGDELEKTIDPINEVNFKNRAHQEQLKGILYTLGTKELVGREPDSGVWAGVEDAIAALKGAVGGLT
jgi:hypothetical protein